MALSCSLSSLSHTVFILPTSKLPSMVPTLFVVLNTSLRSHRVLMFQLFVLVWLLFRLLPKISGTTAYVDFTSVSRGLCSQVFLLTVGLVISLLSAIRRMTETRTLDLSLTCFTREQ